MPQVSIHRKTRFNPPQNFFPAEAAGLKWMKKAEAQGGPRVCTVIDVNERYLDIEQIASAGPTIQAARAFGRALARMHDAGAPAWGCAPDGFTGHCYFGPLDDPVPMPTGSWPSVESYIRNARLIPMVEMGIARGQLDEHDLEVTKQVCDNLPELLGEARLDSPARVHGDLWSGTLMWTPARSASTPGGVEAVLIDPAAHGGHREEDLAMLDLFGCPYLDDIIEAYDREHPLAPGFESRLPLWQLYPIAGHCVFFGGGYVAQYRSLCARLLESL